MLPCTVPKSLKNLPRYSRNVIEFPPSFQTERPVLFTFYTLWSFWQESQLSPAGCLLVEWKVVWHRLLVRKRLAHFRCRAEFYALMLFSVQGTLPSNQVDRLKVANRRKLFCFWRLSKCWCSQWHSASYLVAYCFTTVH